jgi:hypothetical protein
LPAPTKAKLYVARRRTAYVKTFNGAFAEEVLADLARFCRAEQSTFHADARIHAVLEGRREVWLRIQEHLKLSDDELFALYNGVTTAGADKG